MAIPIAAFYTIWISSVIAYSFSENFRKALSRHIFYMFGLLPNWRLFCPNPVQGDYELDFRTVSTNKSVSEWERIHFPQNKALRYVLINADMDITKCIFSLCRKMALDPKKKIYPQEYLLLLNYIRNLIQPQNGIELMGIQFRIRWINPNQEKIYMTSLWHKCENGF